MKHTPDRCDKEIELKLALVKADPLALKKHLTRVLAFEQCLPGTQHLHSVYFDTPDYFLRSQNAALRLRRSNHNGHSQWMQTLKLGCGEKSALSQRHEFETRLSAPQLDPEILKHTSWAELDPNGMRFAMLAPIFNVDVARTSWLVHLYDATVVEVALDIGQIKVGKRSIPIFELEFELKAGKRTALLDLALKIALAVAVLPLPTSKAERGYALATGDLEITMRAQPPNLKNAKSLQWAAGLIFREIFGQFTANLHAFMISDNPEVIHQTRVGWRRFREALRLFRRTLKAQVPPSLTALKPLLKILGEIRDLDVALKDTLAPLMDAFTSGDPERIDSWNSMIKSLRRETLRRRKIARTLLQDPSIGYSLVLIMQSLDELCAAQESLNAQVQPISELRHLSRSHISKLHKQLKLGSKNATNPESQHRLRILAKRMRYSIEALRTLLPKHQSTRWCEQATSLQEKLGIERDVFNAGSLVQELGSNPEIFEFLREIGVRQTKPA